MHTADFTMTDTATGKTVRATTRFHLPYWVRSGGQVVVSHFARIWCDEQARRFFGTDDVTVRLNVVDGIKYAY